MIEYMELTRREIEALPRDQTIFLSAISPIEVHGSHLPVGTDYFVAREVMKKLAKELDSFPVVHLPDLPLGADVVGAKGSLPVRSRTVYGLLLNWGMKLSDMGFKYWVVCDNHAGVKHQGAFVRAARKLLKRQFYLIAPLLHIFQEMVNDREEIGLPPGMNGDWYDAHAGTNETSLMLVARRDLLSHDWSTVPRFSPGIRSTTGNIIRRLGYKGLANAADWLGDPDNPFYMGAPAEASEKNGEIMLSYHVKRSKELLYEARNGKYEPPRIYRGVLGLMTKMSREW
jgi:creatinine amidohydrolase